jgi:DNA-directed RNA polymerase specialized sigma24 family protein
MSSAVCDQLAPVLFGVIKRVLRDHAMSEEVTQEVFVEMWSAVHKFDPDRASVMSWAVTIARRRAVERLPVEQRYVIRLAFLEGRTRGPSLPNSGSHLAPSRDASAGPKRLRTDMDAEVYSTAHGEQ